MFSRFRTRRVIDPHAGIVDGRMDDAVRIGLRRPDVVVDRLGEWLARGVEFEDRDDLARLRLLDQVVIVKAPMRPRHWNRNSGRHDRRCSSGAAGRRGCGLPAHRRARRSRSPPDRSADERRGLRRSRAERTFGRSRAAARHRLVLARPVKHTLGARIIGDHPLIIVVGMMRQRLDGGAVAGAQRQRRRDLLAEVAPVDVGGRNGKVDGASCNGLGLRTQVCFE